jgi:hypothetical protein
MTTREHEHEPGGRSAIDVEAEEVTPAVDTDVPAQAEPDARAEPHEEASLDEPAIPPVVPPEAPRRRRRSFARRVLPALALVIIAVVAGAALYRSFGERFWPSDRMHSLEERVATLDATTRTLNTQLNAVGSELGTLKSDAASLSSRADEALSRARTTADGLTAADGKLAKINERIGANEQRLGRAEQDLKAVRNEIVKLGTASGGTTVATGAAVSPSKTEDLERRLTALEQAVADLKSKPAPPGVSPEIALLSQALADFKAKVASGAPFEAESQAIARLVPGVAALDRLMPYAASGVPTPAQLADELDAISAGLPGRLPEAAGNDEHWWSFMTSVVTVRTVGQADWKAICAKAAADIRAGNLAMGIARLDGNDAPLPPELVKWREKAGARAGAGAAVEDISEAVLRVIGNPAQKS